MHKRPEGKRTKDMTRFELWGYVNHAEVHLILPALAVSLDAEVHGPSHDFNALKLGAEPEVTYAEC